MTTTEHICPHCGKPVPATALHGLCPECMLKAGVPTENGQPGDATTAKPPPPTPAEIAKFFPQLEILECLGRGGMGVVYKARQPRLDRLVALKVLAPEREKDPQFAERFAREAKALARLNHPNIVTVHDFGEADGLFYLMMEYVDGLSLRELLRTRKLASQEALAIVPKICEALQFAHDKGVVHRDIKPENVLVDTSGQVKIADFGIAKIVGGTSFNALPADRVAEAEPDRPAQKLQTNITGEQILGTPHYMAPEQVAHPQSVDHRADIYSLGVVFYEMLTGELPLGKFAPPSRKVQVDVRLDEIVLHALEKEPERRYQHASEVKSDVETIAADDSKSSVRSPNSEAEARLEILERRRRAMLLYGFWASVIGLPVTLALRMPHLSLLAVAGIIIGGFKLGLFTRDGWRRLMPWLGKAGLGRTVMAEDTAARWAQLIAFGAALLLLVLGFWKLSTFELKPVELIFGVLLVLILSLLMVLLGYAIRPVASTSGRGAADPARKSTARRRTLWTALGAALIGIALRVFVIGPYHAMTDSVSPDVPQGSYAMVFKLARSFTPGDIVVFRGDGKRLLGRVATSGRNDGILHIARRDEPPRSIPASDVIGRVILSTRARTSPRVEVAAPVGDTAGFGPVIERVVNDDSAGRDLAIDFESGKLFSLPPGLHADDTNAFLAWVRSNGIDAIGETSVSIRGLVGVEMIVRPVAGPLWESLAPQAALENDVLKHGTPGMPAFLSAKGELPETYLFKTREGAVGLLQITGFTEKPRGVKLRYKLVNSSGAAMPPSRADPSPPAQAKPGEFKVTLANGVSCEVVAVTRNPLASKGWWRPDGTPLPQPPGDLRNFTPAGMWKEKDVGSNDCAILVRFGGQLTKHSQVGQYYTPRTEFLGHLGVKDVGMADVVRFPADTKEVTMHVSTAAGGEWEPVAVFDGTQTRVLVEGMRVLCTNRRQDPNGDCLDVSHNVDRGQYALRMMATFKDSKRVEVGFHPGVQRGREAQGVVFLDPSERDLRAWDIVAFTLERTPWISGVIHGIVLQPKAASAPATSAPPAANREVLELRLKQAEADVARRSANSGTELNVPSPNLKLGFVNPTAAESFQRFAVSRLFLLLLAADS